MAQGKICTQWTSWHRRISGPLYGSHLLFYVSERNAIAEPQHFTTTVTRCSPTVPFVEFSSSPQLKNDVPEEKDQKKLENEMSGKVELVLSQKVKHMVGQKQLNPKFVWLRVAAGLWCERRQVVLVPNEHLFSLRIYSYLQSIFFLNTNILRVRCKTV